MKLSAATAALGLLAFLVSASSSRAGVVVATAAAATAVAGGRDQPGKGQRQRPLATAHSRGGQAVGRRGLMGMMMKAMEKCEGAGGAKMGKGRGKAGCKMDLRSTRSPTRAPTVPPTVPPTPDPTAAPTQSYCKDALPFGGHLYALVPDRLSWEEAKARAQAMECCRKPGHLVTLTSAEENAAVSAEFMNVNVLPWIGLFDEPVTLDRTWVTGEAYIYDNVREHDTGDQGTCYSFNYFLDGSWIRFDCSRVNLSVVEFDCD